MKIIFPVPGTQGVGEPDFWSTGLPKMSFSEKGWKCEENGRNVRPPASKRPPRSKLKTANRLPPVGQNPKTVLQTERGASTSFRLQKRFYFLTDGRRRLGSGWTLICTALWAPGRPVCTLGGPPIPAATDCAWIQAQSVAAGIGGPPRVQTGLPGAQSAVQINVHPEPSRRLPSVRK